MSCERPDETGELDVEKKERLPAEDTGVEVASWLLQEIEKGGVVDSTHQVRLNSKTLTIDTKIDQTISECVVDSLDFYRDCCFYCARYLNKMCQRFELEHYLHMQWRR